MATRRPKMIINITVLQKLHEAKVDLFEIIKNNHQYLLNSFTRVIKECENAKKTVEPEYLDLIQNIKNQWVVLRDEYIASMVYEYKRQLNAWNAWRIITYINNCHFNTDQVMEHMLSEQRFKLPWPDYGSYYQRLLEIQSSVIRQFPEEVKKMGNQKFTK